MPVNEDEPIPQPTGLERFAIRSRAAVGISDRMPARVIILFIVTIACASVAPVPVNIVGVTAVVLLALDTATHRR